MGQGTGLNTDPTTAARERARELRGPHTPGTQAGLRALTRTTDRTSLPVLREARKLQMTRDSKILLEEGWEKNEKVQRGSL